MNAEEQTDRLETALSELGVTSPFTMAAALYAKGVRVLKLDEVILSRSDAALLDLVRQATDRWDEKKAEARAADIPKTELILAALNGAGKPLTRIAAIQAAAGWHRDYTPPATEWDPWRAGWRTLQITRQIRRAAEQEYGVESTWEPVP